MDRPGRARPNAAGPALRASRWNSASRGQRRYDAADAGMVTAEFAVALPAFVLVVVAAICGVAVVTAQLRCADAADVAARMAARGDGAGLVRTTALSGAPGSAGLALVTTADTVTATVRARLTLPSVLGFLPGVVVQAHVVEEREPSESGASGAPDTVTGTTP